jgi:predicted transcriptional regulator
MADLKELTALIVGNFVEHNPVTAADLPQLVRATYAALSAADAPAAQAEPPPAKISPAAIRKSMADPAHLISFIDGKPYKTLKRHVGRHGLTPAQYKEKYGLPADYPMVARNTTLRRTEIALEIGLGRKKGAAPAKAKGRTKRASAVT